MPNTVISDGNLVFLSCTTGTDENNELVGPADIVAQTRPIYWTFEQILQSVGASCENIYNTTAHILTTETHRGPALPGRSSRTSRASVSRATAPAAGRTRPESRSR